jgi:hypothetical protein
VFRRTKTDSNQTDAAENKGPGAKGRPTPSRKEAEAARKERARAPKDKKVAKKAMRDQRAQTNEKIRQGMKTGDERYLPARDQGPVKKFIRNFVDARVSIAEFLLPLLVVIMVLQYSGNKSLLGFSNALWTTTIIVVTLDTLWLMYRLKRALRDKFPDESLRGTTFYTIMRVLQLRFLRMPKPRVKIGGAPR